MRRLLVTLLRRPGGNATGFMQFETWSKGLFVPVVSLSHVEKASAEQKAEQVFLELLNQFNGDRNNVSAKDTARNYTPTKFANEPKAKEANVKKDDFKKAMRRLLDAGKIKVEDYGSPAHGKSRLVTP